MKSINLNSTTNLTQILLTLQHKRREMKYTAEEIYNKLTKEELGSDVAKILIKGVNKSCILLSKSPNHEDGYFVLFEGEPEPELIYSVDSKDIEWPIEEEKEGPYTPEMLIDKDGVIMEYWFNNPQMKEKHCKKGNLKPVSLLDGYIF